MGARANRGHKSIVTPKTLADAWYSTLADASATGVNRRIRIESFLVPSDPGESLQLAKYSLRFPSAFRRLATAMGRVPTSFSKGIFRRDSGAVY
jgi:hypothetical protein